MLLPGLLLISELVFVDTASAAAGWGRGAVILDARGSAAKAPFVRGTRVVDWMDMRDGIGRTGRLDDDLSAVARELERAGARWDRKVYVIGAMGHGWGEEGRIWWTLRYLGHPHVYIVDGGIEAWAREGFPIDQQPAREIEAPKRDRTFRVVAPIRVGAEEVKAAIESQRVKILDTRTAAEYEGATPYFEYRGGHIPSALFAPWEKLVGMDGKLLSRSELLEVLDGMGVPRDGKLIAYCTGGVRSAFVVAVLRQLGRDAANYDGSFWDWSQRVELPVVKPQ
ncbi:MAG: sulfurtransferase [Deltaproteobacteria bacterium]|nr:sulfurtransferase [Deltaproteobacteria bacterium]